MQEAQIVGNVGSEPEIRTTQAGRLVCSVGVAVHTGQDTPPIWWDCTVWGEEVTRFAEKVNKGDRVHLNGLLTLAMRKNSNTDQFEMKPKLNVKSYHIISRARAVEQTTAAETLPPTSDNLDAAFAAASTGAPAEDDDIPF